MNHKHLIGIGLSSLLIASISCSKDDDKPTIGNPPSEQDAQFTYAPSASNPNIIDFTASNQSLAASWDFGNGSTGQGGQATAVYPFAGTYTVTLTVQNSGGSRSSSQDIVIQQDDPSLVSSPLYDMLTGGPAGVGYKVWAVDSAAAAHMGVGPNPVQSAGYWPEWWASGPMEKPGGGMYDDRYVFHLQGFQYDMITNGDVYVNSDHAGIAPMTDTVRMTVINDFKATFPDQLNETWTLTEGSTDTTITFSGQSFAGYWAGAQTYRVITLDTNELFMCYVDGINSNLMWYIRLRPEGYVSNPGPGPSLYSLPLDFETVEPELTTFGGTNTAYIANPDMSGINTSSKVLEITHGNESWAGFFVNLDAKLDFSANNFIRLNVWAPDTGTFRLKLEDQADPNSFIEKDISVTTANSWVDVEWDMTGTPSDFDRLVLFPGWGLTTPEVFYLDNVRQE